MRSKVPVAALLLALLASVPLLATDPIIRRGIDVFTTPADGSTYYDFATNPIPAGFFCERSKAFAGRVAFRGLPLATGVPGQLWNGDTVVERLDDAAFDATGVARTRIQFRALSLVSLSPLRTACGDFHLYATLGGQQRVTPMTIRRTEEKGGEFTGPLAVRARLTFIPVKPSRSKGAPALELTHNFTFPSHPIPWSFGPETFAKRSGPILVDTDGDLTPDTLVPGPSNFTPNRAPKGLKAFAQWVSCCPTCHDADGEQHCFTPARCNLYCDQ